MIDLLTRYVTYVEYHRLNCTSHSHLISEEFKPSRISPFIRDDVAILGLEGEFNWVLRIVYVEEEERPFRYHQTYLKIGKFIVELPSFSFYIT